MHVPRINLTHLNCHFRRWYRGSSDAEPDHSFHFNVAGGSSDAEPDHSFHFNVEDPDPTLHFDLDPDPDSASALHQSAANLRPLVYSTALFLTTTPQWLASSDLHGFILILHSYWVLTLMRIGIWLLTWCGTGSGFWLWCDSGIRIRIWFIEMRIRIRLTFGTVWHKWDLKFPIGLNKQKIVIFTEQMKNTCNYKRCFAEYFVFFPTFVEKIALSIFLVRTILLCFLFPSLVNCSLFKMLKVLFICLQGRSQRCLTYKNQPLSPTGDFVVKCLECWTFSWTSVL